MTLRCVASDADAEFELLGKANEKGKFGVPLNMPLPAEIQLAFERGIDAEWFRLVDISAIAAMPGMTLRIFKLTEAGAAHLAHLKRQAA